MLRKPWISIQRNSCAFEKRKIFLDLILLLNNNLFSIQQITNYFRQDWFIWAFACRSHVLPPTSPWLGNLLQANLQRSIRQLKKSEISTTCMICTRIRFSGFCCKFTKKIRLTTYKVHLKNKNKKFIYNFIFKMFSNYHLSWADKAN